MSDSMQTVSGLVVALWRYPVKSMQGEELNRVEIGPRGLLGDRAYALIDGSDGKIGSAKNPRKWPRMFDFRAALVDTPQHDMEVPAARITLPDGTLVMSDQSDLNQILSQALARQVTLEAAARANQGVVAGSPVAGWTPKAEEYWPDMEGLDYRDTVTDFDLPTGTFFDCATVHVLTTATLDRLRELYPQGRFELRRFRPNVVVELADDVKDFVENGWVGLTLVLGNAVRLRITGPCPRCVMTTLPQSDLPKDPGILRTAAQHNQVNVGVYASVVQGGVVRRGDAIRLEEN
jgi:uncharacterized protein YcbX